MKIHGVTQEQVDALIEPLNLGGIWKNPHLVFFVPTGERWRIKGKRDACVHGYGAAIHRILRAYPFATIETAVAIYDGLASFEERQGEILAFAAKSYPDKCSCKTTGAEMDSTPSESLL